jgi:hypothetical protein
MGTGSAPDAALPLDCQVRLVGDAPLAAFAIGLVLRRGDLRHHSLAIPQKDRPGSAQARVDVVFRE